MKKRLFSGSAPSGRLTIGNYLGALRQWSENQEKYDSLFCIVDLHALTVPGNRELLTNRTLEFLALYLACGLNPDKSTIFIQSHNPRHCELAWILGNIAGFGELTRMTQFKAKSEKHSANGGLLNYPVLMAADILLYKSSFVPVGSDQKQHLELARTLAERFNRRYEKIFPLPEPYISKETGRIMNLQDPTKKMDKSHGDPRTYISLLDSPDDVRKKIGKAKTDSRGDFPMDDGHSGMANLVTIYSSLTGLSPGNVVWEYEHRGYGAFKKDLAEIINEFLKPLQKEYYRLRKDEAFLGDCLARGRNRALDKSEETMDRVKKAVGLIISPSLTGSGIPR